MKRRHFLRSFAFGLFWAAGGEAVSSFSPSKKKRRMLFGWTTCLTYETGARKLGYDHFSRLLEEMKLHGMSRLIVVMASHGYYSPGNHGLAWPVTNPRLKPMLDDNALNAHEETEFFSRVIDKAHKLGIEILIEIKYLGMVGIKEGYPGIEFLTTRNGGLLHSVPPNASEQEREAIESLHICPDSEQAHQYMRDKITDVLERYIDLDGIVLEHPSYSRSTCYCKSTRKKLFHDTGKDINEIDESEFVEWKNIRIRDRLTDLKGLIKSTNAQLQFGFYTGFSPTNGDIAGFQCNRGHSIETLRQVGFDFVLPYCEGRHGQKETREIERVIHYLRPLKIYLHTTIRRTLPRNYRLPTKGPEYIKKIIAWGKEYFKKDERFLGMTFFNEVKIPEENRKAVYVSI